MELMAGAALYAELSPCDSKVVLLGTGRDDQIARMASWLKVCTPLIKPTDPPGGLELALSWPALVQLSLVFASLWRPGPRLTAWIAAEMLARTQRGVGLSVDPPAGCVPRPYQVEGALMIAATGRGLLLDDPGTGKTITAILGLKERAQVVRTFPAVVICPASVVDPWVDAFRQWAPHWHAVAWRGPLDKRRRIAGTADVYVGSYNAAATDAKDDKGLLVKLGAASVIVDEFHMIKTPDAARSKGSRRLVRKASNAVLLSGTPITHHPGNLWPALEAMEPGAWPSSERWNARYLATEQGDYAEKVLGLNQFTEPEFRMTLLGRHRRVAKADVLPQLPPKVYSVRVVELPPEWRKVYNDLEEQMYAELPDGQELMVMQAITVINFLGRLASAPADVRITKELAKAGPHAGEMVEHRHLDLKAPSWKVDELLAIMAERPGQPVLSFSDSRQLAVLAGEAAERQGFKVGYVIGGQGQKTRTKTREAFQAGELDLLAATTGSGGVGLTLTAAGTVVVLQRPWGLVEAIQIEDRAHRIGSEIHECIEIIDILADNTVDTRVRQVLREKGGQLSDVLQDPRIVAEMLGGHNVRKVHR